MRDNLCRELTYGNGGFRVLPENFGLAYDVLGPAPEREGGGEAKYDANKRDRWLSACADIAVCSDYAHFFQAWKDSLSSQDCKTETLALRSRLLIGHGNRSAAEVGLTVHRTWGVPMISGSAVKGLAANYAHAIYGKVDDRWRGVGWEGSRIVRAPGAFFARLFGSPDVDGQQDEARQGEVVFHDALYIPGSAAGKPFTRDVMTVHQKNYYNNKGKEKGGNQQWPTDWDSPNPIGFVTVKPGTKFLLALTAPEALRGLALRLVREALEDWGAGGKTSLGYGRLATDVADQPQSASAASGTNPKQQGSEQSGVPHVGARVADPNNPARLGTIVAPGSGHPPRWRVRWDDNPQPRNLERAQFRLPV